MKTESIAGTAGDPIVSNAAGLESEVGGAGESCGAAGNGVREKGLPVITTVW